MQHDWIPSTLGHGETMCRRCFVTNREAAVLGIANECDVPQKPSVSANDNVVKFTQDQIDDETLVEGDDGFDAGEECGRWINGRLGPLCRKAGSEECDWDCPYSR